MTAPLPNIEHISRCSRRLCNFWTYILRRETVLPLLGVVDVVPSFPDGRTRNTLWEIFKWRELLEQWLVLTLGIERPVD